MTFLEPAHPQPLLPPPPPPPPVPPSSLDHLQHTVPARPSRSATGPPDGHDGDDQAQLVDSRPSKRRKLSDTHVTDQTMTMPPPPAIPDVAATRYERASWPATAEVPSFGIGEPWQTPHLTFPVMPDRPWPTQMELAITRPDARPAERVRKNVPVPTVPDSMQVSDDAPRLEDGRRADYFPWTGNHPEDVLNENAIKSGYFDRAPNPAEKELNTAKAPLYNASKHRAGVESLSALFSLVLDDRNARQAYSSVSSFKGPPPRVTLTETKRRSWIADLADLEVPLKRLSKTIPQGIRGQALFDQCLLHRVPLSRALWFIKCVGANEIRTLKRKGINVALAHAAEAKWLREWTVNVGQFVESLVSQMGQQDWKEKADYAVRLAGRLYAENLLDRDHHLDWVIKCFSTSHMDRAPFWLMVVHLYKVDLLAFRKRGRQAAEAMVLKYNHARRQSATIFQPFLRKLGQLLRESVRLQTACFVNPDRWLDCKTALQKSFAGDSNAALPVIKALQRINERARGGDPLDSVGMGPSERVVQILDAAHASLDVQQLSTQLGEIALDQTQVMEICVQWAVSKYRTGSVRVYLVARLLRQFHEEGCEVDLFLLDFLPGQATSPTVDLAALRHLTSELSRTHTFSVSRYLQWLTVRGLPHPNTFVYEETPVVTTPDGRSMCLQVCSDQSQLLTECGFTGYAKHVHNLQRARLAHGGYDEEQARRLVEALRQHLRRAMDNGPDTDATGAVPDLSKLPWSIRSLLSQQLCAHVLVLVRTTHAQSMQPPDQGQTNDLLKQFCVIRAALEQLNDMSVLVDVLQSAAVVKQESLLATVADTINYHGQVLSAMGALVPLQEQICQAYLTLRPVKTAMPMFATSLVELCLKFPIEMMPVGALRRDLVRGDRSRAVAARSPFSDGVAVFLQQAGDSFYDDFEALLQTESNMSEGTSTQLFELLITRIHKLQQTTDDGHQLARLYHLLYRFQLSRPSHGHALLRNWLVRSSTSVAGYIDQRLIMNLIATRCLDPDTALEISGPLSEHHPLATMVHKLTRAAFASPPPRHLETARGYAFRLEMAKLLSSKPTEVFGILAHGNYEILSHARSALVVSMILAGDADLKLAPQTVTVLEEKVADLLGLTTNSASTVGQTIDLLRLSGPLSTPFSQFKLHMQCHGAGRKPDESTVDELANAVRTCLENLDSHMAEDFPGSVRAVLRALGPAVSARVRAKIDHGFFQALPKFLQNRVISHFPLPSLEEDKRVAQALQMVRLVNTDIGTSVSNSTAGALIEKLSMYLKCLGSSTVQGTFQSVHGAVISSPTTLTGPAAASLDTTRAFLISTVDTLDAIMQMVCVKRTSLNPCQSQPSPAAAKQSQQDQIKLIGLIITIATHPAWTLITDSTSKMTPQRQKAFDVVDYMLEVTATLVDDMAEESRVFCARILKEKTKDPRIKWLLGSCKMFGSQQFTDVGNGLELHNDNRATVSEFKPKHWEMLEGSGGANDASLGLGLFSAIRL